MRAYDEDETEDAGSELEQMIAMLERAEQDVETDDDDEETILDINNSVRMIFDEHGELLSIGPVPH